MSLRAFKRGGCVWILGGYGVRLRSRSRNRAERCLAPIARKVEEVIDVADDLLRNAAHDVEYEPRIRARPEEPHVVVVDTRERLVYLADRQPLKLRPRRLRIERRRAGSRIFHASSRCLSASAASRGAAAPPQSRHAPSASGELSGDVRSASTTSKSFSRTHVDTVALLSSASFSSAALSRGFKRTFTTAVRPRLRSPVRGRSRGCAAVAASGSRVAPASHANRLRPRVSVTIS